MQIILLMGIGIRSLLEPVDISKGKDTSEIKEGILVDNTLITALVDGELKLLRVVTDQAVLDTTRILCMFLDHVTAMQVRDTLRMNGYCAGYNDTRGTMIRLHDTGFLTKGSIIIRGKYRQVWAV